ncbi:glycosyltransferase 87 family protein [Kribbella sp. CA-293567]|uniref:glycosyltransferase 87 family protein n=1 Tax=Kribbella sp. CA-293567 TaxID=3002436 RepID=UPI0022DD9EEA|nr:glycosyltransferase 87 family protein [Kribbella sp. CA-293567]WBQ05827.1 glycosyltransferase 87 family protein [Kribbella sp. CA-293567]
MKPIYEALVRRHFQLLLLAVALTPLLYFSWSGNVDLNVYRTGGYAWLNDISLYSEGFGQLVPWVALPFTYPPLAAVLFVPLHLLPMPLADLALCITSAAALTATMLVVSSRLLRDRGRPSVMLGLAATVAAFAFEPVRSTIGFGQVNLILMALVTLDCLLPRTRWPRGVLVGLAAAIKLTPAVFVLYFLVRRQYREAAVAVATFVGLAVLGFAFAPRDSAKYWFGVLFDPDRIGGATYAYNQCFQAFLSRVMADGPVRSLLWLGLVAVTGVLAAVAARRARAAGDDVLALLAIATWGLLASPVSWSHHWVWVVPAALYLGCHRHYWMLAATILFLIGPHTMLDPEGRHWSWPGQFFGAAYVILGLAFLTTAALSQTFCRDRTEQAQALNSEARIR